MLPVNPSQWMAVLFPPALGLNPRLAAGTTSGSSPLLPDTLTTMPYPGTAWQLEESLAGFEGCLENVT